MGVWCVVGISSVPFVRGRWQRLLCCHAGAGCGQHPEEAVHGDLCEEHGPLQGPSEAFRRPTGFRRKTDATLSARVNRIHSAPARGPLATTAIIKSAALLENDTMDSLHDPRLSRSPTPTHQPVSLLVSKQSSTPRRPTHPPRPPQSNWK